VSVALVDYFLKLDGIQGESRDLKHKGEIELESFFWGETNPVIPHGGGGGVGKVQVEDLHVVMKLNKASPLLFLACATGEHIKGAILTARRALKAQQEFLVYKLTDLLVSEYHQSAGTDAVPVDQVSFNFSRIQIEYRPQKPDGSLDASVKAGWDVKENKKA
jgi:type VI secretion system secreted protein Hcp